MSQESQPEVRKESFSEEDSLQRLMAAEVEVLVGLFGEDGQKWSDWLNFNPNNGEHVRELLRKCYSQEQSAFSDNCVSSVIDVLHKELDDTGKTVH